MAEPSRKTLIGLSAIILLTLAAYTPAFRAGFVWDDDDHVSENRCLRDLDGLKQIWFEIGATPQYYPLVFTSFWLEHHLWGQNPAGYHGINVLLHAVSAVLLWLVLRRLTVPGAWLAAAIFALHPVHVESVAWITERKNVLSGVFYLSSLLAYLRFCLGNSPRADVPLAWRYYVPAVLLFAGALLSKTVTCSLPVAILLLLWWKRERFGWREVLPLIPFFVLGAGMGLTTVWIEKHHIGAEGPDWSASFAERCLIAGRAFWFYVSKLLWPAGLTFIYPRWRIDSRLWWPYLYPAAVLAVIIVAWALRRRLGKGPLLAIAFFAVTLSPALGFFDVYPMRYSFVSDHFQYLASIGPISLFVATLVTAFKVRRPTAPKPRPSSPPSLPLVRPAFLPAVLVLGVLATLTWRQTRVYRDPESLWTDTLRKNPSAWMAHDNLSVILITQGKLDEALSHIEESLRLKSNDAEAYSNRGSVHNERGAYDLAIKDCTRAIQLRPDLPMAYNNRGNAYRRMGAFDLAIQDYTQAIELKPDSALAYANRGGAYGGKGDYDLAIQDCTKAIELNPSYAEAYNDRANAYSGKAAFEFAIRDYTKAIELKPDFAMAYNNRGSAYMGRGAYDLAVEDCTKAIEISPGYTNAYRNRAVGNYWLKRYDKAWEDMDRCRQLGGVVTPEFLDALSQASSRPG